MKKIMIFVPKALSTVPEDFTIRLTSKNVRLTAASLAMRNHALALMISNATA
ncbi:hypothetical protein D3C77_785720 [compost metagenome]